MCATDNGTEVVISNGARSVINAFKLELDDKFRKLSTEIGRLRIEGGATRAHYDNLLTMTVDLKNSIQQFNFGIPDPKPIDVHDPNYREPEVVNTLDGRRETENTPNGRRDPDFTGRRETENTPNDRRDPEVVNTLDGRKVRTA